MLRELEYIEIYSTKENYHYVTWPNLLTYLLYGTTTLEEL